MKQNSRQAWRLLKNLSGDPTSPPLNFTEVTPNQIAHHLILNGKTSKSKSNTGKLERCIEEETDFFKGLFMMEELTKAIDDLKPNKAAGLDDLRAEQIKQFGPATLQWLLSLMNNCTSRLKIPKIWRKARVVAILKPGKTADSPKNFRPISLLCHTYKLLERMVLNRISDSIDGKLIPEQAGFRPGRSCCGQILNLTQYIEDGFEEKYITGVTFIDLTAAYDTVNHNTLLRKIYELTKDYRLTSLLRTFLENRRFYVSLLGKNSRWRLQKNGLPQGSVLAPLLYNIYTNDQPRTEGTRRFIYADDTAVAVQGRTFEEVENSLSVALEELGTYYHKNNLKPNPTKTQVCAFHLRNKEAKRTLNLKWQGERIFHCFTPKYLGVALDRTLSFKQHCLNTKGKVSSRNNILRCLTGRTWGAHPSTLRTSALGLSFSAAEYAAPVWLSSPHAKEVDIALNETARIVSGCLRPTPLQKIYPLIGISPPHIRRMSAAASEKKRQESDSRHPLYGRQPARQRLKSRSSFLRGVVALDGSQEDARKKMWKTETKDPIVPLLEKMAPGYNLPYGIWKSLNRLRTGVSCCKTNLKKWNILVNNDELCDCGMLQEPEHLLICPLMEDKCSKEDLMAANNNAITVATYWQNVI